MKIPIIKINQNDNNIFSAVIPFAILKTNSKALIYGKDPGGYQREPDERHFLKIKKYILETEKFSFPTAILLGLDFDLFQEIYDDGYIQIDPESLKPIFRIIDGQHRLRGILEASLERGELDYLELNTVIVVTNRNERSREMEIFHTVNSTTKRIKVDLIQLAKYEYQIIEGKLDFKDLNDHISMQVAKFLNEDKNSIWYNAIKFGIHDELKVGIIGVAAFMESISTIVNCYINSKDLKKDDLIPFSRDIASHIKEFINGIWNEIIREKWYRCFKEDAITLFDYDEEIKDFVYDSSYYIQKNLGAKSLNGLLGQVLNEAKKQSGQRTISLEFEELCKIKISDIIFRSRVMDTDWLIGKTFSGYSSESAYSKVGKMITGEIEVIR